MCGLLPWNVTERLHGMWMCSHGLWLCFHETWLYVSWNVTVGFCGMWLYSHRMWLCVPIEYDGVIPWNVAVGSHEMWLLVPMECSSWFPWNVAVWSHDICLLVPMKSGCWFPSQWHDVTRRQQCPQLQPWCLVAFDLFFGFLMNLMKYNTQCFLFCVFQVRTLVIQIQTVVSRLVSDGYSLFLHVET